MRMTRLVFCGAAALVLLGPGRALPLHGQSGQTPAPSSQSSQLTFKTTTALVEVDVVIHDGKNRFVPGLTADDLLLYEDGKPQKIQQFYIVTHDPYSAVSAAPIDGAQAEDRAHRVFVLMFDESSLANDSMMRVKKGAEQFIREQIGPGDVGGVFVNGAMYKGRLTTDRIELAAGVRSVRPAFDNRQGLLAPFREWPKIPGEIDAVRIEAGGREVVDMLGDAACREDPFLCNQEGGIQQVENVIQRKARLYVRQARVLTAQTMQNLRYVAAGLSRIPGRKTVVLMTEGFFVEESRDLLQTVAAQAARGGTAIYTIDGRGNSNNPSPNVDVLSPSPSRSTGFDTGEDGPMILTMGTGGFMVHNIDDISRAFGLIARDTSTYYVLGYAPENSVMDGKYRKIDVKSRVAGLDVRARKGYMAVALPPLEQFRSGGR
jgi:VWFA-related protein